jgi:hypothetical protein
MYHKKRDVILAFKMMTSDTIKPVFDQSEYTRKQGNPIKLHQKFKRKHKKFNFFTNCVCPLWNSLSESTMLTRLVDTFKDGVDRDWSSKSLKMQWEEQASLSRIY